MIHLDSLKKSFIGKWVIYNDGRSETKRGRIKSWNDKYIFVVFKCDGQWHAFKEYIAYACNPEFLTYY